MTEKTPISKLIILNSGVAIPTAASRLFDPATGADVLAVNGVGVFEPVAGSGSPKASSAGTVVTAKAIEIIKRRNTTGDKSPLPPRAYERSGLITTDCMIGLEWSGAPAETGTSQSYVVGAPHGVLGAITPVDDSTYTLVITADGAKTDKIYGKSLQPTLNVSTKFGEFGATPELAQLTTTQQSRDYIISAIVDKHNVLSSNQGDVLSIGVAVATSVSNLGGAVAYNVAAITALSVGTYLTIGYNANNSPVNMLLTQDNKSALLSILAAANTKAGVSTAAIVQYAMPTSANAVALGAAKVAGGAGASNARIDMIGFVTVDVDDTFYDETFGGKRRLSIGLDIDGGFDSSVYVHESSVPTVGTGHGSNIKQWYKNIEHYTQYTSSKDYGAMHIAYPDDIVESGYYDVYSLYHCANRSSTGGMPVTMPKRLIVAIPNFTIGGSTAVNSFYTGTANTQKAAFQAIMNPFAARVGLPAVSL